MAHCSRKKAHHPQRGLRQICRPFDLVGTRELQRIPSQNRITGHTSPQATETCVYIYNQNILFSNQEEDDLVALKPALQSCCRQGWHATRSSFCLPKCLERQKHHRPLRRCSVKGWRPIWIVAEGVVLHHGGLTHPKHVPPSVVQTTPKESRLQRLRQPVPHLTRSMERDNPVWLGNRAFTPPESLPKHSMTGSQGTLLRKVHLVCRVGHWFQLQIHESSIFDRSPEVADCKDICISWPSSLSRRSRAYRAQLCLGCSSTSVLILAEVHHLSQ